MTVPVLAVLAVTSLALASPPCRQDPARAPGEPVQALVQAARARLDASVAEVNKLRDEVAAEKLPLSQRLTAAEETLTAKRRASAEATAAVDTGTLELAKLRADAKAKQDEHAYVGDRLDEYLRNLETRVHVSELQYCGTQLIAAKQAFADATMPASDKLATQLAFARVSVERLGNAVGGMRFPGIGVDANGDVVEGQFTMLGPLALFAAKGQGPSGVVVPQTGSDKPLIRPLDGDVQTQLQQVATGGDGTAPIDPSLGGALAALVQQGNLIHVFEKGGPIMWPLLAASILALATVLERLLFLANERRKRDPHAVDELLGHVARNDIHGAQALANRSKDYVVRTLGYALANRGKSLANALEVARGRELKRFRRGISILDSVITLAPLLGLLGTVTGMMGSFSIIGGDLGSPGAITGGIAEALIATAFGLGIAITALLPFNYLNTRVEAVSGEIEAGGKMLEMQIPGHHATVTIPQRHELAIDPIALGT